MDTDHHDDHDSNHNHRLVQINPANFQFTASRVSPGYVSKVRLTNLTETPIGFKFKTNAPKKYSVKPVLGVIDAGQSIRVTVRAEGWISPQDRFLLQSVALTDAESQSLTQVSWKRINATRLYEDVLQCTALSVLTIRDHEEDAGAMSSSSASSSTSRTFHRGSMDSGHSEGPMFHPSSQEQQESHYNGRRIYERWQHMEATRPSNSSAGSTSKRLSISSMSSASSHIASSSSPYPTLFHSRSRSVSPVTPTSASTTSSSPMSSRRVSLDKPNWSGPPNSHSYGRTAIPGKNLLMTSTIPEESICPTKAVPIQGRAIRIESTFQRMTGCGSGYGQRIGEFLEGIGLVLPPHSRTQLLMIAICLVIGFIIFPSLEWVYRDHGYEDLKIVKTTLL